VCLESAENELSGTKIRTTEPTVSLERTTGSDSFGRLQKLNLSQRFLSVTLGVFHKKTGQRAPEQL